MKRKYTFEDYFGMVLMAICWAFLASLTCGMFALYIAVRLAGG